MKPPHIILSIGVTLILSGILSASATVPTGVPPGSSAPNGGYFSLFFSNIINTPCAPNTLLKGFDTTPGANYGKRQCVALPITAIKDALSGFDSTTGAPVYMNAWLKNGTNVYYNTAGGNVGIGTSTPTAKLDIVGNIKASGNITTPASTVLTSGKIQVLDVVTLNTACTPNGLIARDSVGLILSCQSGVWKSITANTGKQIASQALSTYKNSTTQKLNQWGNRPLYSIDAAGNLSLGWYNSYVYKCNISAGSCSTGNVPGGAVGAFANYNGVIYTPTLNGLSVQTFSPGGCSMAGCSWTSSTELYIWGS